MARKVKVDFTGVEAFQRVSEGIHHAKISDIQEKTSQGGDSMLQVAFEVTAGEDKGNKVFDNLVLTDKALWKFKSLLQIIGMKCDGKVAVDLDKLIGKTLDINVTHEEYNGQIRARVSDYMKSSAAASSDDEDEDEDSFDDDDVDDTEEEEAPKPKKKPAAKKPAPKKKPEPEEDEDDDWDEDDDEAEEEEEEKPAPKKKAPAKKAPAKRTKKKPEPVEEDDDEDEDDDDDWEED